MRHTDVSFTFLDRVREVEWNIVDQRWQSALALALTLPDICGSIAYPEIVKKYLDGQGIKILGTSADAIDLAEDRERFEELCDKLGINRPKGLTVFTEVQALEAAEKITYPILMRPSYVLGGQNMIIARNQADVKEYMKIILQDGIENPVLIDKYMEGKELEVDCICDGIFCRLGSELENRPVFAPIGL